jgi:hypothetical protein
MVPHSVIIAYILHKLRWPSWSLPHDFLSKNIFSCIASNVGPPLSASGRSPCIQSQNPGVKFPALPDFLRSTGSRTE